MRRASAGYARQPGAQPNPPSAFSALNSGIGPTNYLVRLEARDVHVIAAAGAAVYRVFLAL